jgi:amino acid adenylation domain-containing protein
VGKLDKKKVSYDPFENGEVILTVPTTESQREMWATVEMLPEASLCYNESIRISLKGALEREVFEKAFQEMIRRHDALRSSFIKDGRFFLVTDKFNYPLDFLDLSNDKDASHEIEKLIKECTLFKFDLIKGPLFKARLVKVSEREHLFFFSAHHIVCDGWSMAVMVGQMSEVYSHLLDKKRNQLPWPSQFSAYSIREHKGEIIKSSHAQYWKNEFKTIPKPLDLPGDFERESFRTYDSKRIDLLVDPILVGKIKKLGGKLGMSYYTTLMTAFEILIHKLTKKEDLVIGISSATQSVLGEYDLCGHLVNLLPIRLPFEKSDSFESLGKKLKKKMLDGFDHQSFTFGSLLNELKLERDPSRIPLINIIFNVDQQYEGQGLKYKGLDASYTSNPRHYENFEIFINATSCGDKLVLECQYNTKLFKHETILNWLENYIEILELAVRDKTLKISDLNLKGLLIPLQKETSKKVLEKEVDQSVHPEEEKLTKIWEEVLQIENIPRGMDFFSLGGHSLLANDILLKIKNQYDLKLTLKDFFLAPTIMQFAKLLGEKPSPKLVLPEVIPGEAKNHKKIPLSINQVRTWYLEEIHKGATGNTLTTTFEMDFAVKVDLLEEAINLIIKRHDALRTRFLKESDGIFQVVENDLRIKLDQVDCHKDKVLQFLREDAASPFDLSKLPLIETKLLKTGKNNYVFYIKVHHIVWDGWSFDIFFEELNHLYASLEKKMAPTLLDLNGVTYADYALYNGRINSKEYSSNEVNFWVDKLKDLPVLELPIDYSRPVVFDNTGKSIPFVLSNELASHLRNLAKENGVSLYVIFLSAWNLFLSKLSGESDIVIGTPVRGRHTEEVQRLIGFFVNIIPLRNNINQNMNFSDLLKEINLQMIEAFDHQHVAFDTILKELSFKRDNSRTAVYQAFFTYQDVSNREFMLGDHKINQRSIGRSATHTDLDLWVKTTDEKVEGAIEYRTGLFKDETAKFMLDYFVSILEVVSLKSSEPIRGLNLLPKSQENLFVHEWNDTWTDWNEEGIFYKCFERQALKNPDAIATTDGKNKLTYKELDQLANSWANHLIREGVVPGDLVGLSVHRHNKMLVALLAILKAGAGYVPLDPGFPQDRLDYMIESSELKIMIVEDSLLPRFQEDKAVKLLLSEMKGDNEVHPGVHTNENATAYVIYTSGSTGLPKGVQLPHKAVHNFLKTMAIRPGMNPSDKLLAVTTLSFDIAVLELYLPLITGGTVRIAQKEETMDGEALKNIIENENINMMQATPSTWRLLLSAGWSGDKDFKLLCGGEPFPKDLNKSLHPMVKSVWNMYGPTETTVWSTIEELTDPEENILIGKPIANTACYILDENQRLLPLGHPGELYIGGLGLADGYKGRQDLTDERFIPNPFRSGEKMYNTGDLARLHSDGRIECLGRNDGQVKVRGYRIELGEIESVLSEFPGITQSVVIVREDRPGDVRLVGYYIKDSSIDQLKLRSFLGEKIPSYMIPSNFVEMDEFPKTLNEKIDKKNLPAPQMGGVAKVDAVTTNLLEEGTMTELHQIWCELLGQESIDVESNFFDVGGHSLLSVQLFSMIEKKWNLNLGLATLFTSGSIMELSGLIDSKKEAPRDEKPNLAEASSLLHSLVEIKKGDKLAPIFCFHGVGGNILNYMALVPGLEAGRGLYGLQSYGVDGKSETLPTIEAMAEAYVREIRTVQTEGPYYLAGGSMGGYLALEAARILQKAGEEVADIIMFDTFGPDINLKNFSKGTRGYIDNLKIMIPYRLKQINYTLRAKFLRFFGLTIPHNIRHFFVELKNYSAIYKYKPSKFDGGITLFKVPTTEEGIYSDPNLGWGNSLTGKLTLYEVEGEHNNIIEAPGLPRALKNHLSNSNR